MKLFTKILELILVIMFTITAFATKDVEFCSLIMLAMIWVAIEGKNAAELENMTKEEIPIIVINQDSVVIKVGNTKYVLNEEGFLVTRGEQTSEVISIKDNQK